MHPSKLGGRLREILRTSRPGEATRQPAIAPESAPRGIGAALASAAAAALGGSVIETDEGPCLHVRRTYAADHAHGWLRIGDVADDLHDGARTLAAALATSGPDDNRVTGRGLLFVDIETTGLSGGAGTYAFLVGCASVEGPALHVDQFFMLGHALERALLAAVRSRLAASEALVTYNGKTFDLPVLETRFLVHRQPPPFSDRPHVDLLHTARRLWRGAPSVVPAPGTQSDSCALGALEQALFGVRRHGDVPGFEIPARFFSFLRSADARPLAPVLEHNRLDLVSLAALTGRVARLMRESPDRITDARECYGVGRLIESRGGEAEVWFARAVALSEGSWHDGDRLVRLQALRALALICRRAARHAEAAGCWERIARSRPCPPRLMREALEALAIHHEHRSRDLERARRYAERTRDIPLTVHGSDAVEHRLARLRRKMETGLFSQG